MEGPPARRKRNPRAREAGTDFAEDRGTIQANVPYDFAAQSVRSFLEHDQPKALFEGVSDDPRGDKEPAELILPAPVNKGPQGYWQAPNFLGGGPRD